MILNVEQFGFFHGIMSALSMLVLTVCVVNVRMNGSTPQVALLMLYGIIMMTYGIFRLGMREEVTHTSSIVYLLYRSFISTCAILCVRPYPILRFSGHKTIQRFVLAILLAQFVFGMVVVVLVVVDYFNPLINLLIIGVLGSLLVNSIYTWYCQFKIYRMIMNSPLSKNDAKMKTIKSVSAYSMLTSMVVFGISAGLAISPLTAFLEPLVQVVQALLFAVSDLIIMTNKEFTQVETKMSQFSQSKI